MGGPGCSYTRGCLRRCHVYYQPAHPDKPYRTLPLPRLRMLLDITHKPYKPGHCPFTSGYDITNLERHSRLLPVPPMSLLLQSFIVPVIPVPHPQTPGLPIRRHFTPPLTLMKAPKDFFPFPSRNMTTTHQLIIPYQITSRVLTLSLRPAALVELPGVTWSNLLS